MELQNTLPSGWDSKLDKKTGKTFYINHYTKTTTWEDPRLRNESFSKTSSSHPRLSNDYLTMQHGSPDIRRNYVYPSQSSPIPAFQIPGQYSPKYIPLQDLRTNARISPLSLKTSQTQDSSLTDIPDTEESLVKISAMFPTVSNTHIRLLLKKYHGREAVVISALQVEKHPITTPGPFATPPAAHNIYPGLHSSLQMTPPLGYSRSKDTTTSYIADSCRNFSRPHSSPKLKLRYMKCIFPKAEETVILDVLTNSDNNIQKASEWLRKMGYERKDPTKVQQQAEAELQEEKRKNQTLQRTVTPQVPKIKASEEKLAIKSRLQERYKDIIEQVIIIALDSVQYDEDRANQILQIMVQEENKTQSSSNLKSEESEARTDTLTSDLMPEAAQISQNRQSFKNILGTEKKENATGKSAFSSNMEDKGDPIFKSHRLVITHGPNLDIVKGANEKLLLADYIPWQGTNPHLKDGCQKGLAKGPNKDNLSERKYKAVGPNPQLCKGTKRELAKETIFQQIRNVINTDSRGL